MTISSDGKVEIESDDTPGDIDTAQDVNFEEDTLTFSITIENGMELSFDLEFDGDSYEGTVAAGEFGSFPISGSKNSSPE